MQSFIKDMIKECEKKEVSGQDTLNKIKNRLSKKHKLKQIPTNIEILCHIPKNKLHK